MKTARNRQRGGLRNRENYQAFIEMKQAYLDDFQQRISRLATLVQQGYTEEATLLACCYLDALGYFRYLPGRYESKKTFIKLLLRYGKDKDLSRVSLLILGRLVRSANSSQGSTLLAWTKACEAKKQTLSSSRTI